MNKQDLIQIVHADNGGSRAGAERLVDLVFNTIKERVKSSEKVSIAGFGIFTAKSMKSRDARNPRTGESVKVPSHTKAKFVPAKKFKQFINSK
jgi:DNA-binding protein HU-beta